MHDPAATRPSVAVKDMIAVAGMPQTAGLPHWAGRVAERDAAVVARFRAAGCGIAGVTATDQAGFGTMTDDVGNPVHPERAVGGSSGGSAAAVAARLADVGLGTDTGGSVRIPAAYCDLFAFKPSNGRVPMDGIVPLSPTFDAPGVIARDATTLAEAARILLAPRADGPPLARILVDGDAFAADPAVARPFAAAVEALGAAVVETPDFEAVAVAHSVVLCAEAFAYHRDDFARNGARFPPAAAAGLRHGARIRPAELDAARRAVDEIRATYARLLGSDGLLLLPTLPMPPAARRARAAFVGGAAVPITEANIRFTVAFNVAATPVVVAPVAGSSVQFVGPAGRDEALLAAALPLAARLGVRFGTPGASL